MKRLVIIFGMTLVTFPLGAFVYWSTTCACEKEPGPHFAAWNPFRDRGPERVAERLFHELSTGHCEGDDELLCQRAMKYGRVARWTLSTREVNGATVSLVYEIAYADPSESTDVYGGPTLVGVDVRPAVADWTIVRYTGSEW